MLVREEEHKKLKDRANFYAPETTNEAKLQEISLLVLESNPLNSDPDADSILEVVRDWPPPAQEYYDKMFHKSPLMTISNLKKVMEFYGVNLLSNSAFEAIGIPESQRTTRVLPKIVWICLLIGLIPSESKKVIQKYAGSSSVSSSVQELPIIGLNSQSSTCDSHPENMNMGGLHTQKLEDNDRSIAEVRDSIGAMQPRISTIPNDFLQVNRGNSNITRQPGRPFSHPPAPKITHMHPDNPSWRSHREEIKSYASVGHIPTLPKRSTIQAILERFLL